MAVSNELRRFEADLAENEDLRAQVEEIMRRIAESGEAKSDGEALSQVASELGYAVGAADFERASAEAESEAPDLDDLESAAGGMFGIAADAEDGHEAWCLGTYYCFTALVHGHDKAKNRACLSDYVTVGNVLKRAFG